MKILVITPYIPWPLHGGSIVRIFNLSRELSRLGHDMHLLAGRYSQQKHEQPLEEVFTHIHYYNKADASWFSYVKSIFSPKIYPTFKFQSPDFYEKLHGITQKESFDAVLVIFAIIADLLPSSFHENFPVILDQHEFEELIYKDYLKKGSLLEKGVALLNLMKIKSFYRRVFSKVDMVLSVSPQEVALTKKYTSPSTRVICVPNGVNEGFLVEPTKSPKENIILFCGNLAVRRNIDAVMWFAHKIFPAIRAQVPHAQFYVVGSWPSPELEPLKSVEGVNIIGQVDDIKKYYAMGKVFVMPYYFGAGTKLKTFEAMAMGLPIVSTSLGCRGVDVVNGEHVVIADSPEEFATSVVTVLTDGDIAYNLAKKSQELVVKKYIWSTIAQRLADQLVFQKS